MATTKDVTKQAAPIGPPAPLAPLLARAIDVAMNGLDMDGTIVTTHAPTDAQTVALRARRGELAHSLTPGEARAIGREVALLLNSFVNGRIDEDTARMRVTGYVDALNDLPLWAVTTACHKARRGEIEVKSLEFAPSPPQLRKAAKALIEHAEREMARIKVVLEAPRVEFKPDARIGQKLRDLAAALGEAMEQKERPSDFFRAIALGDEAGAKRIAAGMLDGVGMSPALASKIGRCEP